MIGYTMGTSMAGPVTVALAPSHGWQAVFIAGGIGSLLAAALLFFTFPESIRYLTSRNKRPDLVAGYLNKLDPTLGASPADAFIAADEEKSKAVKFKVARLFDGELRWITPFLWLAYIASSMAIFFGSSWGPLVFEYIGFSRDTAALFSSVNSIGGAVGGLLLMRFTDRLGAISIVAPALVALPLLLIQGFGLVSGGTFLFVHFLGTMAMGAVHFGLHSIAGVFYPSAYRANGAGWTTSVAKIGSIAGPLIGGMVLSTDLPVLRTFALMAICPAMVVACIFVVGRMHSRIIRRERADAATAPAAA
jgi:AAHS family 4-hydroxybenzoate transporter-like MFS transporter